MKQIQAINKEVSHTTISIRFRRPRVLWIDVIGINQTDLREQGEQVSIMWNIFHAAESVAVWLGPEE